MTPQVFKSEVTQREPANLDLKRAILRRAGLYGLYRPLRKTYHRLLRPKAAQYRRNSLRFLGEFIGPGSLVFDIGAYIGTYSDLYSELGARVVAVEPNPDSARLLRARLPNVTLEVCAVGQEEGVADFYLGGRASLGTLSKRFAGLVEDDLGVKLDSVRVPVTTLGRLFEKYGVPDFLKIDVEGSESEVLAGIGAAHPLVISFEFHTALPDEATSCLELLPDCRFRICVAQNFTWDSDWLDAAGVVSRIHDLGSGDRPAIYGDVYAFA